MMGRDVTVGRRGGLALFSGGGVVVGVAILYLWPCPLTWLYPLHQGTQSFFKAMLWG